nr:BlaI/MecI/CopY family transcriptional regulator [Clostridia bacterium]
ILERLEGKRDWSMSTLHVLLARMSQRGVIASENEKNYKLYVPSITKEYYRQHETKNFIQKLYDNSAKRLIVSLIETNGITDDEIDEISRLLNEKKKG